MKKESKMPDWDAYKKLNKKDREKILARIRKETEKVETAERREQVGGSSGSGIARDPGTGRAIVRNEVGGSSGSGIPRDPVTGRAL